MYLSNGLPPPFALLRNIGMQLMFLALLPALAVAEHTARAANLQVPHRDAEP